MLLCANLVDPALASVARGRGPAVADTVGMSTEHGPPPAACGCGAALCLSARHGPLRAARDRGLIATATPGL